MEQREDMSSEHIRPLFVIICRFLFSLFLTVTIKAQRITHIDLPHIHLGTMNTHSNTPYRESCGHRRSAQHQNTATTMSSASQRDAREGGGTETATEEKWTDLEYRACGRAHLSVGILWILLNMRSRRLRMRMRAGRTASDDQSVMGSISVM